MACERGGSFELREGHPEDTAPSLRSSVDKRDPASTPKPYAPESYMLTMTLLGAHLEQISLCAASIAELP
jgi:hypothetical protein